MSLTRARRLPAWALAIALVGACRTTDGSTPRSGTAGSTTSAGATATAAGIPPTDTTPTTSTTPFEGCVTLLRDPANDYTLAAIPETDGPAIPILDLDDDELLYGAYTLVAYEGAYWACNSKVYRIDPATGNVNKLDVDCTRMHVVGSELHIQHYVTDMMHVYATGADVAAGVEIRSYSEPWVRGGPGATDGNTAYVAWVSDDTLDVVDLTTQDVTEMVLESFDTWVSGMHASGGVITLLDDGRSDEFVPNVKVYQFDATTGARLSHITIGQHATNWFWRGLYCGPPP